MAHCVRVGILSCAVIGSWIAAGARADPRQAAADGLCLSTDLKLGALFALIPQEPQFPDHVARVLERLRTQWGPCLKAVLKTGEQVEYVHEKAIVPGRLVLDEKGLIIGVWFSNPVPRDDTPEEILTQLKALPGQVALTVRREGAPDWLALQQGQPLAVGSTFKLFVLQAVLRQIESGALRWEDVVPLRPGLVSFPSGMLQDWPPGSPVTVHTLASLMISISDNTATDHLLFLAGRREVEHLAGERNRPFLSTQEVTKLKSKEGAALAMRYRQEDETGRRRILGQLEPLPRQGLHTHTAPTLVEEVEWFFSTDSLCDAILSLKDQPILRLNPGIADREDWTAVAYKGGSEPGVLNMTLALQHPTDGAWWCVSSTWNHPSQKVTKDTLSKLLDRLLQILLRRPPRSKE